MSVALSTPMVVWAILIRLGWLLRLICLEINLKYVCQWFDFQIVLPCDHWDWLQLVGIYDNSTLVTWSWKTGVSDIPKKILILSDVEKSIYLVSNPANQLEVWICKFIYQYFKTNSRMFSNTGIMYIEYDHLTSSLDWVIFSCPICLTVSYCYCWVNILSNYELSYGSFIPGKNYMW